MKRAGCEFLPEQFKRQFAIYTGFKQDKIEQNTRQADQYSPKPCNDWHDL